MKPLSTSLILSLLLSWSFAVSASSTVVTNGNNEGAGSLREALLSGATSIRISSSVNHIVITETLNYEGRRSLVIDGNGQTVDASSIALNQDILSINNGANLFISDLSFVGNFESFNEDATTPIGGKGIYVDVPLDRTGIVLVQLTNVSIAWVGNHGVHVSDCTLGNDCAAGSGGGGEGSPASIYVQLKNVLINEVGFGKSDADGLRVDDRGDGSIYLSAYQSRFLNVGADGIELDEGNDGFVAAFVNESIFDSNGEYCNCVTSYQSGPCDDDGDRDVDDGFDIDEAGNGSLYAKVTNSAVTNNFDEGLDFDEEDAGSIEVLLDTVYGAGNADEAIKMSEKGNGNVVTRLTAITTAYNNSDREGIELEEADEGDLIVTVLGANMIGNIDEQLKLEQDGDGEGFVEIIDSVVDINLDGVNKL